MAKKKIQSTIHIADGAGGMVSLADLRFDVAEWPIRFDVPADLADDWIAHLNAECNERGWSSSRLGQLGADANSGTIVVNSGISGQSLAVEIVWERPRGSPIQVCARPAGNPPMTVEATNDFLNVVRRRCQAGTMIRRYCSAHLIYEGLPWSGELWLENDLRLGPPSRRASWLLAPQVIIVDAEVEGIGPQGVNSTFELMLRKLSVFLNVVVGIGASVEKSGWAWTYERDPAGKVTNCDLRPVGYWEVNSRSDMPRVGEVQPIPLRSVERPGLERLGIWPDDVEQSAPQDTVELWRKFKELPAKLQDQFLRAGNAYKIARSMWPE